MSDLDEIIDQATWPEVRESYPNGTSRIVDTRPEAKQNIKNLFSHIAQETITDEDSLSRFEEWVGDL